MGSFSFLTVSLTGSESHPTLDCAGSLLVIRDGVDPLTSKSAPFPVVCGRCHLYLKRKLDRAIVPT